MELIERFTEEKYYSLQELYKEYNATIANAMWKEITAYRKGFQMCFSFFSTSVFIVLCKQVMMKTILAEESFMRFLLTAADDVALSKSEQLLYELHLDYENVEELRYACNLLGMDHVLECLTLLTMEIPFLLRVFLILQSDFQYKEQLLFLACNKQHNLSILPILLTLSLPMTSKKDKTRDYLTFLADFDLQIKQAMVSCNHSDSCYCELSAAALGQRYPDISQQDLLFFVAHRKTNRYYTIAQYMEVCDVCYETARKSMERFVAMQWYNKRKMGKKFVYYIRKQ